MRLSSPSMAAALIDGAADGGADVLDLGIVGTEMVYFAVGELGLDGGVCVTASHNPKQYTGMKIVRRGALPVGGESGLLDVRDRARLCTATQGPLRRGASGDGDDIWDGFVEKVLSFVDVVAIKPLKVVIDAANGMAGAMLPPVLERLPIDAVTCYFEPDGTFPNHEPNPLLPENREFIVGKTLEEHADLGVAYDGDADRCFFVDDTGEFVPGDFVTALLAESILEKEGGGNVIYDVRASRAVPETIERAGGTALINRVGHAYIKHRMRKEDAVFGGEVSAHYYFRDFSQADSGVVPFLLLLELISKRGRKLSEILAPYRERFFLTGEINTPVADVPLKLQELKERYADGTVTHLDGISVDYDDWHFNVRPSNTEPLPAPQPGGVLRGADGAEAGRGARPDPPGMTESGSAPAAPDASLAVRRPVEQYERTGRRLERRERARLRRRPAPPAGRRSRSGPLVVTTIELGRVTDRKPPFKYSAIARVWFSDTDAQGIVYYGRYLPYFDHARTEYHRHLGRVGRRGPRLRDARLDGRVPRAGALRRPARDLRAGGADRPDEHDVRVRRLPDGGRRADGDRDADARPRRPRASGGRARSRRSTAS